METIFSVYQIDVDFVWEEVMRKPSREEKDLHHVIRFLLERMRMNAQADDETSFCTQNSQIYVYRKINDVKWANMLLNENQRKIEGEELDESKMENISVSYLMFTPIKESIYVSTGGYSSSLVKPYVHSKFGLDLITRLFDSNQAIVKQVMNENLSGMTASESYINRDYLSFINEKDYAKFFKAISADVSAALIEDLGLVFDKYERVRIESSDSFKVNKRLYYEEYYQMLKHIDKIMQREPRFALSYFVPVSDYNIRNSSLFDALKRKIVEEEGIAKDILLTSNDYFKYQSCGEFKLKDKDGQEIYKSQHPMTFQEILEVAQRSKDKELKLSFLDEIWMKWKLEAYLDSEEIISDVRIRDLLQYNIQTSVKLEKFENETIESGVHWFYLHNGQWYVLDRNYTEFIQKEYEKELDQRQPKIDALYKAKGLFSSCKQSECKYHESIKDSKENQQGFFITDKKLVDNIEICDVLTFDDENIYLIGNKSRATGIGCRDLFNQLEASMRLIENQGKEAVFKTLYTRLEDENIQTQFRNEKDFIDFIDQRKINYIAAFTEEPIRRDTRSLYCKINLLDLKKNMQAKGYDFYVYNPVREGE